MERLLLFICASLLSLPLLAAQYPPQMAEIDQMLSSDPPRDAATLAKVRQLRAEGEKLHEAGKEGQAQKTLGLALKILKSSE
ncbi:hypothetical protein ACFOJE_14595 [Azotobacter bryophylli]|uniref:Uncharacterized protein n=1 Tax=Azotobacter bryophylli TaxID=1986537 RepID=A0ABV7AY27_9GAMM